MVWDESRLVVERLNGLQKTEAVLTQMAVVSVMSKDGAKEFKKVLARLDDGGD
jgi:hypothetical protein